MNPTISKPLLSRKDIAAMLGPEFTVLQVRRNEKKWGLDRARVKLKTRMVFYRYSIAVQILTANGALN